MVVVLWISSSTPLLTAHQEVFMHFSEYFYRPKEGLCPRTCFWSRKRENFLQQMFSGLLSLVCFILAYDQGSGLDDAFFPPYVPCSQKRFKLEVNVLLIVSTCRLKHLLQISAISVTANRFISWMTQPPVLSFSSRHDGWVANQKSLKPG